MPVILRVIFAVCEVAPSPPLGLDSVVVEPVIGTAINAFNVSSTFCKFSFVFVPQVPELDPVV